MRENTSSGNCHGRAQWFGAQAPAAIEKRPRPWKAPAAIRKAPAALKQAQAPQKAAFGQLPGEISSTRHVLGAPGRARAAHIVQFRPVRIEGSGEEMLPKSLEFSERLDLSVVADCRGGEGYRSDRCHDAGLCFSSRLLPPGAFFGAENEFWPDLLKDSFNCRDLPHTWYRHRIHPW
jgi:hypothetical protein